MLKCTLISALFYGVTVRNISIENVDVCCLHQDIKEKNLTSLYRHLLCLILHTQAVYSILTICFIFRFILAKGCHIMYVNCYCLDLSMDLTLYSDCLPVFLSNCPSEFCLTALLTLYSDCLPVFLSNCHLNVALLPD